jgi:hypothetical protein
VYAAGEILLCGISRQAVRPAAPLDALLVTCMLHLYAPADAYLALACSW